MPHQQQQDINTPQQDETPFFTLKSSAIPSVQTESDRGENSTSPTSHSSRLRKFTASQMLGTEIPTESVRQETARPPLQAKLTIGQPRDRYEQEADRVARNVVQRINAPASGSPQQAETLQRLTAGELQTKPLLQRQEALGGGEASSELETSINRAKNGGQSLDSGLQQSMGQAMGANFSSVKVHADRHSDQLNRSLQAKAFTTGNHIFFKQGEYNPVTRSGQELVAHELTHVVQQTGTGVQRQPDKPNLTPATSPIIQREWTDFGIVRNINDNEQQARCWTQENSDQMTLTNGWYVRKNENGTWDDPNELESSNAPPPPQPQQQSNNNNSSNQQQNNNNSSNQQQNNNNSQGFNSQDQKKYEDELKFYSDLYERAKKQKFSTQYQESRKVGLGFTFSPENRNQLKQGQEPTEGLYFAFDRVKWILSEAKSVQDKKIEKQAQELFDKIKAVEGKLNKLSVGKEPIRDFAKALNAPIYKEWDKIDYLKKAGVNNENTNGPNAAKGWDKTLLKALKATVKLENVNKGVKNIFKKSKYVKGRICFNVFGLTAGKVAETKQAIIDGWHKKETAMFMVQTGLGITHHELAFIMADKELWDSTDFFYYDISLTEQPIYLSPKDPMLAKLGISFVGGNQQQDSRIGQHLKKKSN